MQEFNGAPLHTALFAGVEVYCSAELTPFVEQHFQLDGLNIGRTICLSPNAPGKLSLVFELATQIKSVAGSLMGLLNRNDIEIELHLGTRDEKPKSAIIKLRDVKDVEACERLIDKLGAVVIRPQKDEE
ncbi:MAG: hypothetical protein E7I51_13745 [Raoultella sp.]|uniref:hypothetical protein n=1 Tax=Klebsiella grimontii TaxID=2058152 RepID=UPI0012B98BC5|nr:hypothetical protein [Klebsiella grimontii]MDU4423013.1 hypothetical protein [Raoultella sp.]